MRSNINNINNNNSKEPNKIYEKPIQIISIRNEFKEKITNIPRNKSSIIQRLNPNFKIKEISKEENNNNSISITWNKNNQINTKQINNKKYLLKGKGKSINLLELKSKNKNKFSIGPNIKLKDIKTNFAFNKSFDSLDEQSEFFISFLKDENIEEDENNKENINSSLITEKNLESNFKKNFDKDKNKENNNNDNQNNDSNNKKDLKRSCFIRIRCFSNNNSTKKKRLKTDPVFNSYFSTLNNTKRSTNLSQKSLRLNDSLTKFRKKKLNGIINNKDKEIKGNRSSIIVNTMKNKNSKNKIKRNRENLINKDKNICKCQIF